MLQVLAVVHVLLSAALITMILMHSGRDTGLGGMGFTPQSQGGTHIVERNLTRVTVIIGILCTANPSALSRLLAKPAGSRKRGGAGVTRAGRSREACAGED